MTKCRSKCSKYNDYRCCADCGELETCKVESFYKEGLWCKEPESYPDNIDYLVYSLLRIEKAIGESNQPSVESIMKSDSNI